jgi:methylphosphonate synthase
MSRNAPFKPEWIRMLRAVEDADPNNPDIAFNRGHFLHQFTYFVGRVNFYWEESGKRHCAEMRTGDSCFIPPFIPHSFTAVDLNQPGLIIAVTYAGEVRRAVGDISRLPQGAMTGDAARTGYGRILKRLMDAESLTVGDLRQILIRHGVTFERASELAAGDAVPSAVEADQLARVLRIRPADLCAVEDDPAGGVSILRREDAPMRPYPDNNRPSYEIQDLVRPASQPDLKAFEMRVASAPEGRICHHLHEYVYVLEGAPVVARWGAANSNFDELKAGDSVYFSPMIPHSFHCENGQGRLVVVRVPGRLSHAVMNEYARLQPEIRERISAETRTWF